MHLYIYIYVLVHIYFILYIIVFFDLTYLRVYLYVNTCRHIYVYTKYLGFGNPEKTRIHHKTCCWKSSGVCDGPGPGTSQKPCFFQMSHPFNDLAVI